MGKYNQSMRSMRAWQRRCDPPAKAGDLTPNSALCDVDLENPAPLSDFRGKKPANSIFSKLSGSSVHIRRSIFAPQSIMEHGRVTYANGLGPFRFKPAELSQEEE
jgi:hypothetical protein